MRIYFVNRFFHPDFSATSQLLSSLVSALGADHEVTVVTSRALYNDSLARLPRRDQFGRVEVLRLNTTRRGRERLLGRALDYASFYLRVFVFLLRNVRKGEVVVLKTDPPMLSLLNTAAIRFKGGQVINWLQDLFPEIAAELGVLPGGWTVSAPLIKWRNRTLRAAACNVVISERMGAILARGGVSNTRCIPNWADGERVQPLEHADNALRAEWNPRGRFLVGYSGNFGRTHSFEELLEAMTLLERCDAVQFALIGEGAGLDQLLEAVERRKLHHVSFYPYQPNDSLRQSLGAIDLHVVTLKPAMEGLVMPSKIYGALAAGRPIAFVGDEEGEIAAMIRQHEVGFALRHGDGAGLAERIQQLASSPETWARMAGNARRLFDAQFAMPLAVTRWRKVLDELNGQAMPGRPGVRDKMGHGSNHFSVPGRD